MPDSSVVVQPPVAPKPPVFKIDPDTAYAFAVGTLALVGSSFTPNPEVAHALQFVGGELALLGTIFHLDGK
jgi:hypothetical protein